MRQRKINLSVLFLLGMGLTTIQAQQATITSGGYVSGSNGSVSYSVGQVVYITNIGTNGSVAQGVQQPYEISIVIGLEESTEIILSFSVYPNPATNFLKLNIGNHKPENLSYKIFDISGKLLENKKIESNETNISMENFASSSYFLKVIENNKEVKTFNIIKN